MDDSTLPYRAGFGRRSITVYEPGSCLFGWGDTEAVCEGVLAPLFARAIVVEDRASRRRIAYVCCDLGIMSESVRHHVVERIERMPLGLTEHDVMLTATHTHSGPSGFSTYLFYAASGPGFSSRVHDAIVDGIVSAIDDAVRALVPARLAVHAGFVPLDEAIAWNRSVEAYNRNTDVEPLPWARRDEAVDRVMTVLAAETVEGRPLGLVSWFASHGTCLHHQNRRLHPDHKGAAAQRLDAEAAAAGNPDFVSIFAQGAAGDVTPNHRWDAARALMVGRYERDEDSMAYVARIEARRAQSIAATAHALGVVLEGGVDGAIVFTDFFGAAVDAAYADGREGLRTAPPRLGFAFACGTLEGPGPLAPIASIGPALRTIQRAYAARARASDDAAWHAGKFPFLELGHGGKNKLVGLLEARSRIVGRVPDRFLRYIHDAIVSTDAGLSSWTPRSLPSQVLRIGSFVLGGLPNEPTVVAGRRVARVLERELGGDVTHVVVQGYANAYAGYVTTPEEYAAQRYEGGSNLHGVWSLPAFCTVFARIARSMRVGARPYTVGDKAIVRTPLRAVPAFAAM